MSERGERDLDRRRKALRKIAESAAGDREAAMAGLEAQHRARSPRVTQPPTDQAALRALAEGIVTDLHEHGWLEGERPTPMHLQSVNMIIREHLSGIRTALSSDRETGERLGYDFDPENGTVQIRSAKEDADRGDPPERETVEPGDRCPHCGRTLTEDSFVPFVPTANAYSCLDCGGTLSRAEPGDPPEEGRDVEWTEELIELQPAAHQGLTLVDSYTILADLFAELGRAHVAISRSGLPVKGSSIDERVESLIEAATPVPPEREPEPEYDEIPDRVYVADLSGEGDLVWETVPPAEAPTQRDGVQWVEFRRHPPQEPEA